MFTKTPHYHERFQVQGAQPSCTQTSTPSARPIGSDSASVDNVHTIDDDINARLCAIWTQFLQDVIARCPCLISSSKPGAVTVGVYKKLDVRHAAVRGILPVDLGPRSTEPRR